MKKQKAVTFYIYECSLFENIKNRESNKLNLFRQVKLYDTPTDLMLERNVSSCQ